MAATTAKFHGQNQNLSRNRKDDGFSGEPENMEEMIFGFAEEVVEEGSCESSCSSSTAVDFDDGAIIDEDAGDENSSSVEEEANNKAFWESQEDLLMTTLFRTTSLESKIRQATKEAMKEMNSGGFVCVCEKMVGNKNNGCKNCMQKEVSNRLTMAGFNCVICKSKWRKSSEIPSGEHTYMEVVQNPSIAKGEMKTIIELNFRAQFEMARASEEYNRLINKLPEVFVGKFVRLQNLVKILCAALKKSMKERKMHMAPWRKHKYILAKWQGSPDHNGLKTTPYVWPNDQLGRSSTRPRASMLTFDLLDGLQVIPCSAMIRVL